MGLSRDLPGEDDDGGGHRKHQIVLLDFPLGKHQSNQGEAKFVFLLGREQFVELSSPVCTPMREKVLDVT